MHPRLRTGANRALRAAQRTLTAIEDAVPRSEAPPSAYAVWVGRDSGAIGGTPGFEVVGDIALIQGTAPPSASVLLQFGDGRDVLTSTPIPQRFPHPDSPTAQRTGYTHSFDASDVGAATHFRVIIDDEPGDWQACPKLPSPSGMPGVETLETCPACGSVDFISAGRRQQLTMVTCQQCGLMMTSPRPAEDKTLMRYSERYFDEEYLPSQQMTPALLGHIDSILDRAEPAKVANEALFELGVGGGNLLTRASERGWSVHGTDVNAASVAHAQRNGLDVRHENADHAESLGGPYGAIISEMSLEHVRRPEHFCALAAEALAPGGRLVLYTVSAEGDSFEHAAMGSPLVGPAEHLFLFSTGSLVALCERAGLRVDEVWRNAGADEIGVVATKRRDVGNPAARPATN